MLRTKDRAKYLEREAALCDAQRTVGLLRHKAGQYGVDPHKVGVIGFSAGANLAVRLSTNWRHRALRQSGVASETRIYVRGGHGFGLRKQGKPSDKWPLDAAVWLQRVMSGGFQR